MGVVHKHTQHAERALVALIAPFSSCGFFFFGFWCYFEFFLGRMEDVEFTKRWLAEVHDVSNTQTPQEGAMILQRLIKSGLLRFTVSLWFQCDFLFSHHSCA